MLLTTVANEAARAGEPNPFPVMAEAVFNRLSPEEVAVCGVEKILPGPGRFGGRLAMAQWTARPRAVSG